jgi:hypothetical protein
MKTTFCLFSQDLEEPKGLYLDSFFKVLQLLLITRPWFLHKLQDIPMSVTYRHGKHFVVFFRGFSLTARYSNL